MGLLHNVYLNNIILNIKNRKLNDIFLVDNRLVVPRTRSCQPPSSHNWSLPNWKWPCRGVTQDQGIPFQIFLKLIVFVNIYKYWIGLHLTIFFFLGINNNSQYVKRYVNYMFDIDSTCVASIQYGMIRRSAMVYCY